MVVLGIDVHKDTHTAVVVDEVGRQLGQRMVRAIDRGHEQLVRWARREFPGERMWAVEDCRHVSTRLERALLAAGEQVVRVPPKLMAGARDSARTRGKSDPIDALAIARAVLREPNLPAAQHDQVSRDLKLLVDHREDLVAERTRAQNRLRWHLHELDLQLEVPARGLTASLCSIGSPPGWPSSPPRWSCASPVSCWPTSARPRRGSTQPNASSLRWPSRRRRRCCSCPVWAH
jgi:transposase